MAFMMFAGLSIAKILFLSENGTSRPLYVFPHFPQQNWMRMQESSGTGLRLLDFHFGWP
ncbi:hypothetical protein [Alistipes sp.]|uniref:hypothetical protein n=1 Tax=Alistipes sp. TaxID=1872444 RepID=UPI0025C69767|nr:hypothetical protein [Alistipes sp.]MCI7141303.1 hypothetical protein [Alistipes sp.]MDY5397270.1 hypothetical protein [Alistipes sp.]